MRVAVSIAPHEIQMAHRWMDWICELGGTDGHHLHLIPASGLDISALIPKARKAFGGVEIIKDEEKETSDWQVTEPMRSASGPNSSFRQVAWHFYHAKLGPYFWCELDCIPLRKDWLDRLEAEYAVALSKGKVFMGAHVEIENVPPHMTGNGIYPDNGLEFAPTLVQRTNWTPKGQLSPFELAFDIAGAKEVMPKAHYTNLIQHIFRHKGFESRQEFDATIDPNAVVFHSCKDGSIFKYLRENLTGVAELVDAPSRKEPSPLVIEQVAREPENRREGSSPSPCSLPDAGEVVAGGHEAEPASVQEQGGDAKCNTTSTVDVGTASNEPLDVCSNAEPTVQTVGSATVITQTFTPSKDLQNVIEQNAVIKNGLPAMSPPWENREDTERDIKMLCDTLKLFCGAPVYKGRVREALREAKIIK